MCGRFTQTYRWAEIVALYKLMEETAPALHCSWNVAPTHDAGVITFEDGAEKWRQMRWGLVPRWAKDPSIGAKLINARAETLAEKPAFRHALKSRRCVVPISGFYEWQRLGRGKQPYFVSGTGGRPQFLAGLWESWNDLLTFTIITVPANDALTPMHDRMPAILSAEAAQAWLKTGDTSLLKPAPSESLTFWRVSTRVNSPANNDAGLIACIAEGDVGGQNRTADDDNQLALAL